jgi:hypothetical protein
MLADISAVDNVAAASIENLEIHYNASLSDCDIQAICDYLADPVGTVEIHDNAPGCNSQEDVEAACTVSVDESAVSGQQSAVSCYPNPFHSSIEFRVASIESSCTICNSEWEILKVYNSQGQEVATVLDGRWPGDQVVRWDATGLPAGIYYYRLSTVKCELSTGKLVKH